MNCPWFLKPIEASFNDIVLPLTVGSIALIFALRFGFDTIFVAIGFIGVVEFGAFPGFADGDGLLIAGLPGAIGLSPCGAFESAKAGESVRHAVAAKATTREVKRIRIPPG